MQITNELQLIIYEKIRLFLNNSYYENKINYLYNEISKNNYEILKTFTYQDNNYLYYLPNKSSYIKKLYQLIKLWSTENDKVYYLIDHRDKDYNNETYKDLYNKVIKEADMDTTIYKQFDKWSQQDTFLNQMISKIMFRTSTSPLYKFEEVFLTKVYYKSKIHYPNKASICENYIINKRLIESNYRDLINYNPLKTKNKGYLISLENNNYLEELKIVKWSKSIKQLTLTDFNFQWVKLSKKSTKDGNKYLLDLISQWAEQESPLYFLAKKYRNEEIPSSSFYHKILLLAKQDNTIYEKFDNWVNQSTYLNFIVNNRIIDFANHSKKIDNESLKQTKALLADFFNDGINENNDMYLIEKSNIYEITIKIDEIIQSLKNDKENKKQYFIDNYTLSLESLYQKIKQKEDSYLNKLYHYKIKSSINNFKKKFNTLKLTTTEKKYLEPVYQKVKEPNEIIELIEKDTHTIHNYLTSIEKRITLHLLKEGFIHEKTRQKYQEVSIKIDTDTSDEDINDIDSSDILNEEYKEFYTQVNKIITKVLLSTELLTGKKKVELEMTQNEKENILDENIIIMKLFFNQSENIAEERLSQHFNKIEKIYLSNSKEKLRKRAYTLRNTLTRKFIQTFTTFHEISLIRFDKCMLSFINTTYTATINKTEASNLPKKIKTDNELVEKFVKMILKIDFKVPDYFYQTDNLKEAKIKFNKVLKEKTPIEQLKKEENANT